MLIITSLLIVILYLIIVVRLFDGDSPSKRIKYDIKIQNKMLNDYLWIKKVIDSCKTRSQLHATGSLINNWNKLYKNKVDPYFLQNVYNVLFNYKHSKKM